MFSVVSLGWTAPWLPVLTQHGSEKIQKISCFKELLESMSLKSVTPQPTFERVSYHLLPLNELNLLDDPEALFERGDRIRLGVGTRREEQRGWRLIIKAAQLGHPVALAYCFEEGRGVAEDPKLAFEMYTASSHRGHPSGNVADGAC
jgi:TPR repeat protein